MKNQQLTQLATVPLAAVSLAATAGFASQMALIQPQELVPQLQSKGGRPAVFHTGPNVLYRSKHIPGSVYAGPGSNAAGLAMLRKEAGTLARDREIVIYCGCCPWDRCPNVQPAIDLLKGMGFSKVRALYLETGFKVDWIDKGYAVE